jgi:hypothetical protein
VKSDQQRLWSAYCEVGDYFSRLGGSGRRAGFSEHYIPSLVLILALEKSEPIIGHEDALRSLLPSWIWTDTSGLPDRVSIMIDGLTAGGTNELRKFVEFVNSVYQKSSGNELTLWLDFLDKVEELGWLSVR